MTKTHSPIPQPPLRSPGQSLDEQITRLQTEAFGYYVTIICATVAVIIYEWWCWLVKSRPGPYSLTVLGLLVIGFCNFANSYT